MERYTVCPVCTLYLHEGMTLETHLASHPKQKVIEALVRVSTGNQCIVKSEPFILNHQIDTTVVNQTWNQGTLLNVSPNVGSGIQGCGQFLYQQSLSATTAVQPNIVNLNGLPPSYILSPIMNSQMLPYMYQQQLCVTQNSNQIQLPQENLIACPIINDKIDLTDKGSAVDQIHANALKDVNVKDEELPVQNNDIEGQINTQFTVVENKEEPKEPLLCAGNNVDDENVEQRSGKSNPLSNECQNVTDLDDLNKSVLDQDDRESLSTDTSNTTINIRADEKMPSKGELSGQESVDDISDNIWLKTNTVENYSDQCLLVEEKSFQDLPENKHDNAIINESSITTATNASCDTAVKDLQHSDAGLNEESKENSKLYVEDEKDNAQLIATNDIKIETTNELVQSDCFSTNQVVKDHKLQMYNDAIGVGMKYSCRICLASFENDHQFTLHLKIHPLECAMCGKLFYRRQNLQLHVRRHLKIKPFVCQVCKKSFLTKQKLEEHSNTHTGAAPLKCALCDESFRRYSNLIQHRNRYHMNGNRAKKDFVCFVCKQVFNSRKKLAWHKEIHETTPKSCSQCSEKFVHMSSLTRHIRRSHNNSFLPTGHKSNENVECPICKGLYVKSSLEMHIRNHSGEKPYRCLICNKEFSTKWNLKLHKWTHASPVVKPYKCDQCKGAFVREADYISHMNSHKSIRPYTCNHCGAKFIRKYNCLRHVKEHESKKTYNCEVCGKSFHRSYYLNDHMRIHNGVRPYACHICGKTSTTKSNHNKHVMIHHAKDAIQTEN